MFCAEEEALNVVNCEVWFATQHTPLMYHTCRCKDIISSISLLAINTFWPHRTLSTRISNSVLFRIITKVIETLIKEHQSTSFLLIGSTCNTLKWFVRIARFFWCYTGNWVHPYAHLICLLMNKYTVFARWFIHEKGGKMTHPLKKKKKKKYCLWYSIVHYKHLLMISEEIYTSVGQDN